MPPRNFKSRFKPRYLLYDFMLKTVTKFVKSHYWFDKRDYIPRRCCTLLCRRNTERFRWQFSENEKIVLLIIFRVPLNARTQARNTHK